MLGRTLSRKAEPRTDSTGLKDTCPVGRPQMPAEDGRNTGPWLPPLAGGSLHLGRPAGAPGRPSRRADHQPRCARGCHDPRNRDTDLPGQWCCAGEDGTLGAQSPCQGHLGHMPPVLGQQILESAPGSRTAPWWVLWAVGLLLPVPGEGAPGGGKAATVL